MTTFAWSDAQEMTDNAETCWGLIKGAAVGERVRQAEFARRYGPIVRAYLAARWNNTLLLANIDDATQEVFVECLRQNGLLQRVDSHAPGGFRPFLFGATRNVARRFEERLSRNKEQQQASGILANVEADDASLSVAFDRAYARTVLRQAFDLYEIRAIADSGNMKQRTELLRRRFQDDVPIREIAKEWNVDAKTLHRSLDRAKQEFRASLLEIVAREAPTATSAELNQSCAEILSLVSSR